MDLIADSVTVRFGGLIAMNNVTIKLSQDHVLGLIGPNGAGKTTLVNVLSGFQRPHTGRLRLGDREITGLARDGFARAGVVRTFQAVRLFKGLTVSENLEVAFVNRGVGRAEARRRARVLLGEFDLLEKAHHAASALSYGQERRVGLARALALEPKFLLLDEPAAGLAAAEAEDLRLMIGQIRKRYGCGVLIVEHNMALVMSTCDHIHVLNSGKSIAAGTPDEIKGDAAVRAAYLGARAPS
jgi:branched-chain amino acid transport system ATP-binding protein